MPEIHDQGTSRRDSVDADRWIARGTAKVTGNVNVGEARLEGMVTVGGKLAVTTRVTSQGLLEVDGAVDSAGALALSGDIRVDGTLHSVDADLRGKIRLGSPVTIDRTIAVRGSLIAPSLTAGVASLEGQTEIPGDLVAMTVDARLTEDSSFGTIRAKTVGLRAKIPNLVQKVLFRSVTVTARRIEADSVLIEGADVAFVRSPQITLGREAHVTEYEGTIVSRHSTSRVGFESKSPPPYGLRR